MIPSNSFSNHYYRQDSRLWLALRFNKLSLEALHISSSTKQAIVVIEMQRVIYANDIACTAGVNCMMDVTTAQLLSSCEVYVRNHEKETQALNNLAEQLYQFTPHLEIYQCKYVPQSGLLLEISSCLQLFSGVQSLTSKIFTFLQTTPYSCEYGVAHTAKGAWLLTFDCSSINENETRDIFCERLKKLPIQLLHDFPFAVDALTKTGFNTLGDITHQIELQKISSIKKRLGIDFTEAICDIFSIEQNLQQNALFFKPLPAFQPKEFFYQHIQFDYPITNNDQLFYPIENLLQNLSHYLRHRQLECQDIEWTLGDIYRNVFTFHVHSDTAECQWQLLYDLTLIQLDNRELPFEVDSLTLTCSNTNPIQNRNQLLSFSHKKSPSTARSFSITIAKLKARLGEKAIFKLSYFNTLVPDKSHSTISFNETANQKLPRIHKKALRPSWLLSPIAIDERQQGLYWQGKLTLLAGPERIRVGWWEKSVARDYFIAQRHDHIRLWIFLDLHQKAWYVHGIFA